MKKALTTGLSFSFAFTLTFVLLVFVLNTSVSAETSGTTGDCTWTLDGTKLTISGDGAMGDSSDPVFNAWGNGITEVKIESGVTSIGAGAFYGCSKLIAVTIPDSVTSIGKYAFYYCASLASITIPDSVTTIGDATFSSCKALTGFAIPDSVVSIGTYAFRGCTDLKSVTVGSSVKSIGSNAFSSCPELEKVYVTDFEAWCGINFENGEANPMYYAHDLYVNGEEVTELVIPETVESVGKYAFCGCNALTSVTVPETVTYIGEGAFRNCSRLEKITLPFIGDRPNGDKKHLGHLFGVPLLSSTSSIPASLKEVVITKATTIGAYAFYGCTGVVSIVIPDSVASIGDAAFSGCSNLKDVWYEGSETNRSEIGVGIFNEKLLSATWHYNTCKGGNHTFLDENDFTCENCEWEKEAPFVPGDLDENAGVTSSDAIYLLYYTLFGEERYPVNQPVDYDKDGATTSADAIYLLYYTLFGAERYPI